MGKSNKIKQIADGIKNSVIKREEIESLAEKRYAVCKTCPLSSMIAKPNSKVEHCTECGCVLRFKTRSENAECPKGYWEE